MGVLYHFVMPNLFPLLVGVLPLFVRAETFLLPPVEFDLVGAPEIIKASQEDTLLDIARRYDIGQEEILHANPDIDRWLPGAGTEVVIPSHYVLPSTPRVGLVLNTPEMRLYYYPQPKPGEPAEVQTYPVSIGRMDWATPLGETRLVSKEKDPAWRPPESIRAEHEADGDPLPRIVPPGPDNPLGRYAMRLGIPGYLIHGTNKAFGVGMRVSHGCIRMLPEDIETLFPQVPVGTPVRIINQPAKAGWYGDKLFLEVHPPLEEDQSGWDLLVESTLNVIDEAQFRRLVELDMQAVERAIAEQTGLPVVISAQR
jgi:L,D-transpeptidase ErfK/SrfK